MLGTGAWFLKLEFGFYLVQSPFGFCIKLVKRNLTTFADLLRFPLFGLLISRPPNDLQVVSGYPMTP